ncbi:PqqD family protein [Demequina sp. NBRC 110052]|uniref:PqqD family protein n=1 Tax=Demequina sp. NBRC 110052 TaxID=1570341 RepID=UPI0013564D20|nr:PqqD family protein [Demequina sp. NBRC 110052]
MRQASGLARLERPASVVLLNLPCIEEQQSPYVFEGPSFEIWTRIDGTRTEEHIVDELVEAYGAPREQIAHDVHEFLAELLRLGLIVDDDESDGEGEAAPHID